jgi:protein required for attachment to host cells
MKDQARKTWIVVADGGHARILLNLHRDEGASELPLVSRHDPHLASHQTELARGVRHTPEFKPSPERREEGHFLDTLAHTIKTAAARKEFDQLVLVAPATAMGRLRHTLNTQTLSHVVAEVVHDYTHQTNDFIMHQVRGKLPL